MPPYLIYMRKQGAGIAGGVIQTIENPNGFGTGVADFFGASVAIDGNNGIAGAIFEDDAGGNDSGKAYIFNVTTGAILHTLDNPNAFGTSTSDNFGYAVAISGNHCIVSTFQEDDAGGGNSGKAYIFNVTTGALVHTLDNPNAFGTSSGDQFGQSVDMDGNYAIVGAKGEDDAGGNSSGKAYIFDVTTGGLVHTLDNPNAFGTSAFDDFSYNAVGISGNLCAVGARWEDNPTSSGRVYVFDVTTGNLTQTIEDPNVYGSANDDNFGLAVAMSGNNIIVGAPFEDELGNSSSGKAYIINATTGGVIHTLDNPNAFGTSASDSFGWTVAIDGNFAIVGSAFEDDESGNDSGKAYVFNVTTGALIHTLDNPLPAAGDNFGAAIAVNGSKAVVGVQRAVSNGNNIAGRVYVFAL